MQSYVYEGRNKFGEKMRGQIESSSAQAVASWLMESEIAPIAIREVPRPAEQPQWLSDLTGEDRVPPLELQLLTRQLGNMVRAGIPLLTAIDGIQRSTACKPLARALRGVRADLDRGSELSAALGRHPKIFSEFYVNMVRVGENAGRLEESFNALYQQLEFDRAIVMKLKAAMRYPTFVVAALAIGVSVLMVFVIPTFTATYKSLKAELPPLTQLLISTSTFMRHQWWVLLAAGGLGALLWRKWTETPRGRYLWDRTRTRLPIVGPIVVKATIARFCRNFAMASRSGVPLVKALELSARVTDNAFYMQRIMQMRRGVERGESFTRVATAAGIFSPMELQMIAVGEATGDVGAMLDQIAQIHTEDVEYQVSKLSETIEPILLAVMGGLVLILLLGVFLPLWNLGQASLHSGGA